ncbi:MAG: hypothetical protein HOV81_31400 [Kofleriaceae bacterium]|nr:hypothetical protein [Kofleriaceae bacterium]
MRLVGLLALCVASPALASPEPLGAAVEEMSRRPDPGHTSEPVEIHDDAPRLHWRLAIAMRGTGSFAVGAAPNDRVAVVPALDVRVQRALGPMLVGGHVSAGAPAWYGEHEVALSVDTERVLRERADAARISISAGADAGVAFLFFDAPPETSSPDALEYWGLLVRARAQLHVLWPMPTGKRIGFVAGGGIAVSDARYIEVVQGAPHGEGTRVEPSAEFGLEVRL